MSSNRTDAEKLHAILNSTAESIRESSDQDVLEEARLQGLDAGSEAARIRALMLQTVRSHQQRALRSARQAYEAQISGSVQAASIPNTPAERRELFSFILAKQPQYAELFTAQHREFTDLTDADIESYLEDLAELGVLQKMKSENGDDKA